jgi:ribonuclease HI
VTADTEASGHEPATTNNRMEMTAAIAALRDSPMEPIEIVSDSKYVVDCMNQVWYVRWQHNGWKTTRGKPVLNADLWTELLACVDGRSAQGAATTFRWTRGHAGQAQNERADLLARRAAHCDQPERAI